MKTSSDKIDKGECTREKMERQKRELYLSLSFLAVTDRLTSGEVEVLKALRKDHTIIEMLNNL